MPEILYHNEPIHNQRQRNSTPTQERQDSGYNYPPYSNQPYGASGIPVGGGYHNPAYDPCHQSPYNNPYPYNGAGYGQQYYNNQPYQRGPEYNNYGQGNYAYNNSNGTGGVEDLCACCAALCCACCLMEACLRWFTYPLPSIPFLLIPQTRLLQKSL